MIVDAFMLRDELDLLEARLVEYGDLVDLFVVVEGEVQFGDGRPKPLHFLRERRRFARWADRIAHVVVRAEEFPDGDAWARERYQRNRLAAGFADVADDVTVMVGDVDEFPARAHVAAGTRGAVLMRHMVYAPNLEHPTMEVGTVIATAGEARFPQALRDRRPELPVLHGGFHFSWHPGAEPIAAKVAATAHTEFAHVPADDGKANRRSHWDHQPLAVVDLDDTWPAWMLTLCPEWWLA